MSDQDSSDEKETLNKSYDFAGNLFPFFSHSFFSFFFLALGFPISCVLALDDVVAPVLRIE